MEKKIKFTNREIQVLNLAALGYTNKEIGYILKYSYYTIKKDISNIIQKSNTKNRIHAVYQLTLKGYVDIDLIEKQKGETNFVSPSNLCE